MKKIWNLFTDKLGNTILHPQFIINNFKDEAVDLAITQIKKLKSPNVIDIGCGRMTYKKELERSGAKYTGLDHPQTSKLYILNQKPEILADITKKFPVKSSSFDFALLFQVIEYLSEPLNTLKEIKRILKKDGALILSSPFMYPIHDYPYDKSRFTDSALIELLNKSGFKITKLNVKGGFIDFWLLSLNVYLFKRIQELVSSKLDLKRIITLVLLLTIAPILVIKSNIISMICSYFPNKLKNYFPINYTIVAKRS